MAETVRYGTQTRARQIALDVLYAAELQSRGIVKTFIGARDLTAITVRELTTRVVHGVAEHQEEADAHISTTLDRSWTLEYMPTVNRNLAKVAVFEVDHIDTLEPVVIAEAVRLAQELPTNSSPGFLNGLLNKALLAKETNS